MGKIIGLGAFLLFAVIGIFSLFKGPTSSPKEGVSFIVEEVIVPDEKNQARAVATVPVEKKKVEKKSSKEEKKELISLPEVDHISRFFSLDSSKLPIVETVTYTSRVPWLKDRPAWIADYASYYNTSRHFIARSLHQRADYFNQKVSAGEKFNVLRKDMNLEFYLLIDLSQCKMWFYALDKDKNERMLLKTYTVGLGRKDTNRKSGFLTPVGKYALGEKVGIYKPGTMGYFQDQKVEMLRVFGTRWIPFAKEIAGCSESFKGFGLHGAPWMDDPSNPGNLIEDKHRLGKYDSDGCIRMGSEDIEELFSIIITKPTTLEIVKNLQEVSFPGEEKKL